MRNGRARGGPGRRGVFTLFGPELFRRGTGAPKTVTRSISVLDPAATYVLRVRNGGENGEFPRAADATITVNGVQVIGPADLNLRVAVVERPISLQPPAGQTSSTIAITVRGAPEQDSVRRLGGSSRSRSRERTTSRR